MENEVRVSDEMYSLAESWVRSATEAGDRVTKEVAQLALIGDAGAIAEVLDFERHDGDPDRADRVSRLQAEYEREHGPREPLVTIRFLSK